MFSYRHAFHAGNHADVLKHISLFACLQHLTQKDVALRLMDTHAGTGLYRLDSDSARTSQECKYGVHRLLEQLSHHKQQDLPAALQDYLGFLAICNACQVEDLLRQNSRLKVYPGSPAILQHLARAQDQIQLFELQPADMRALCTNVNNIRSNTLMSPKQAKAQVIHENGFSASLRFLPPPSRRAFVLCDPSYELKSDYLAVQSWLSACLTKFATGVFYIWYPVIARPEAHEMPRRLKAIARKANKPWLQASLSIGSNKSLSPSLEGDRKLHTGMSASGIFIVNPPYTLKANLAQTLPILVNALRQNHFTQMQLQTS